MIARRVAPLLLGLAACGTSAPPAGNDDSVNPNARLGPFRPLRKPAEGTSAPQIAPASRKWEHPSVRAKSDDPADLALELLVDTGAPRVIVAFDLAGGPMKRASISDAKTVLSHAVDPLAWESDDVAHPFLLAAEGGDRLYYASGGCVGVAVRGGDGAFTKRPEPCLCAGGATWEGGAVVAPAVLRVGGAWTMFYESGGAIGEATSDDGLTFTRAGGAPVLTPRAPTGPLADGGVDDPFDDARVGDPHALLGASSEGRRVVHVYYTGENRLGATAIGLASRFDGGALTRSTAPVFTRYDARGPSVVQKGALTLLVTGGRTNEAQATTAGGVLVGLAPATAAMPPLPPEIEPP